MFVARELRTEYGVLEELITSITYRLEDTLGR